MKYLKDIISSCVTSINSGSRPVYFDFGYWNEFLIEINDESRQQQYYYPKVYLHAEWDSSGQPRWDLDQELKDVKIYIVGLANRNEKTTDKETNVYKTSLYTIYTDLIQAMIDCAEFAVEKDFTLPNSWKRAPNMAIVNDQKEKQLPYQFDAIEISFNDLKIYKGKIT